MTDQTPRHRWPMTVAGTILVAVAVAAAVGPGVAAPAAFQPATTKAVAAPSMSHDPQILQLPQPNQFVRKVKNRYLPWIPGTRWFYVGGAHGEERITVKVLHRTKRIQGITATVVRDIVREDGETTEDTFDWYAQDRDGNVWYLGENTKEYDNGVVVSTEGSWEAGVNGAYAGIVMPDEPHEGMSYVQEYLEGEAEDQGKVLELSTRVSVPFGSFRNVRMTLDTTTLEPRVAELKFYAAGVGTIRELDLNPEQGSTDLIRMVKP